jgi:hypothetical protein
MATLAGPGGGKRARFAVRADRAGLRRGLACLALYALRLAGARLNLPRQAVGAHLGAVVVCPGHACCAHGPACEGLNFPVRAVVALRVPLVGREPAGLARVAHTAARCSSVVALDAVDAVVLAERRLGSPLFAGRADLGCAVIVGSGVTVIAGCCGLRRLNLPARAVCARDRLAADGRLAGSAVNAARLGYLFLILACCAPVAGFGVVIIIACLAYNAFTLPCSRLDPARVTFYTARLPRGWLVLSSITVETHFVRVAVFRMPSASWTTAAPL